MRYLCGSRSGSIIRCRLDGGRRAYGQPSCIVEVVCGDRQGTFTCCSPADSDTHPHRYVTFCRCAFSPLFVFVACSRADTFFSRPLHGSCSLVSSLSWQPRTCSASSALACTHFPNSSIPTISSVSLNSLLQKACVPGFPGHMRMGYWRMWKLRYVGLSMFRGVVNGPRCCGR